MNFMLEIQNCKAGCLSDFKINHIFYVQAINQVEFFFVQIDQQFRVMFFRASISSESLEWSSLLLFTPILGSKPDEFIFWLSLGVLFQTSPSLKLKSGGLIFLSISATRDSGPYCQASQDRPSSLIMRFGFKLAKMNRT